MAPSLEIIYVVIIYFLSELIEQNNNKILWPSYLMSLNFLPSLISGILSALDESFAGLPGSWVVGEQECITDPLSSPHSNLMLAKASARGFLISPENCSGSCNLKQGL